MIFIIKIRTKSFNALRPFDLILLSHFNHIFCAGIKVGRYVRRDDDLRLLAHTDAHKEESDKEH